MKNVLQHQKEVMRHSVGPAAKKPFQAARYLNTKTEIYMEQLEACEQKCGRAETDQGMLLSAITSLTDDMLETCAAFERQVDDALVIKNAQMAFREKTNPLLSKSYLINRCRTWPRGQQGDFETLEFAYKNTPLSDGIGYYLDKYFLATDLGIGVRDRLKRLRDFLERELKHRQAPRVLDIACGSCREVFELAPEIKSSGARFTCIDLDPHALDFARDRLGYAGLLSEQVELLTYNALRMFDHETALKEFGMQDVIYSVGYFDYLPDDFLVKLLNTLYRMLNPGGNLIAAFKDTTRYRPYIYHWLVDWDGFKQRTVPEFDRLLSQANIPSCAWSMTRVKSGSIIFYTITKL